MITVKLKPDNFLLWRKQVTALLQNQNLYDIVDATVAPPSAYVQQTFSQAASPGASSSVTVPDDPEFKAIFLYIFHIVLYII